MSDFPEDLWMSLPMPAFLVDAEDRIADINPAAESFLNSSARHFKGQPVFDTLAIDAPVDEKIQRVRTDQASLVMNGVDVGSGTTPPVRCIVQLAPMVRLTDHVLMLVEPRELANRLGRSMSAKSRHRQVRASKFRSTFSAHKPL